jgi:flagellar assembly factor FliW
MQIQTTRFGVVAVDPEHIMTFPQGLIGFEDDCEPDRPARFALLQSDDWGPFYWMQSADRPELAFLVVDPALFFKDYQVLIREETQADLNLTDAKDGQVMVICNRAAGGWITGNLLGPLVINTVTRRAVQVVLTEKKWTCRQPLLQVPATAGAAIAGVATVTPKRAAA